MAIDLDPRRLRKFASLLQAHPRKRVDRVTLWQAFAEAFPGRPHGAEERRWLLVALGKLERAGILHLPSPRGRRWDHTLGIAVPTSIDLVRKSSADRDAGAAWRGFPWHPALQWIPDLRSLGPQTEDFLRRVHQGLVEGWFTRPAPIKYRSLQLTGDEKGLDRLRRTALFVPGRLDLALLGCLDDVHPLAWESVSEDPRLVVFENAGAFNVGHAVLRMLDDPPYGMVAFGGGARFESSLPYLRVLERGVEQIHYVGDLDPAGLGIALKARNTASRLGLPAVQPAPGLHRAMLAASRRFGHPRGWPDPGRSEGIGVDVDFLARFVPPAEREEVSRVLAAGNRIPEEVLGPDELLAVWADGDSAVSGPCSPFSPRDR